MHRHVIRHLQRRRQLRAAPTFNSAFVLQHRYASSKANKTNDDNQDSNEADTDVDKIHSLLRTLDQKTLLEAKDAINTHIRAMDALKSNLSPHIPSTIPFKLTSKANPKAASTHITATGAKYTIATHLSHINALSTMTQNVVQELKQVREHLSDLQGEDYSTPGDGLMAWKEEIEGMTKAEKELKLENMLLEEEATDARLRDGAERNAELITTLAERRGVDMSPVRGRRERRVSINGSRSSSDGGGAVEKDSKKVKEEVMAEEQYTLEAMQKRLSAEVGVKSKT